MQEKSLKEYAREAKQRMKSGFWKEYKNTLDEKVKQAMISGISTSKVKEFYAEKVTEEIINEDSRDSEFYNKVKEILDTEGEIPDAIGRLTDKELFSTLSYEEKQRYTLDLSSRYLKAVEKYKKEKSMMV